MIPKLIAVYERMMQDSKPHYGGLADVEFLKLQRIHHELLKQQIADLSRQNGRLERQRDSANASLKEHREKLQAAQMATANANKDLEAQAAMAARTKQRLEAQAQAKTLAQDKVRELHERLKQAAQARNQAQDKVRELQDRLMQATQERGNARKS